MMGVWLKFCKCIEYGAKIHPEICFFWFDAIYCRYIYPTTYCMKKLLLVLLFILPWWVSHAQINTTEPSQIYTNSTEDVFSDEFVDDEGNPIRQGIDGLVGNIGGIFYPQEIDNFDTAKDSTIGVIHTFINYALWLVSLIALIYLIVHGFMIMTAMGDEAKVKKWFAGIKTAGIAIAGIALSWLLVTLIFYVIGLITS